MQVQKRRQKEAMIRISSFHNGEFLAAEESLVSLSLLQLGYSALPLLLAAFICYKMELKMSVDVIIASFRTFAQLAIVGYILVPVFRAGETHWTAVIAYVWFMILLASWETANRPAYSYRGIFWQILFMYSISLAVVCILAFYIIIKPEPLWDPQYVIPIVGMMLGNSITAISLSLSSFLTDLIEKREEVELYLSFGATKYEACLPIMRVAISNALTPTLNSMKVIGLISLPGMFTGQVLGGTPPQEAARYQMLIMYLIATNSFISVLLSVFFIIHSTFDLNHTLLPVYGFAKREGAKKDIVAWVAMTIGTAIVNIYTYVYMCCSGYSPIKDEELGLKSSYLPEDAGEFNANTVRWSTLVAPKSDTPLLEIKNVKRVVPIMKRSKRTNREKILFDKLNFVLRKGEIMAVTGPSGCGKSQLLRLIAGFEEFKEGDVLLNGQSIANVGMTLWRRKILYVTQTRLTIVGTPSGFIEKICNFKINSGNNSSGLKQLKASALKAQTASIVGKLGIRASLLDQNWKQLSGGEAQRILVAISVATQPDCLLLDEAHSALDLNGKIRLEQLVEEVTSQLNTGVLWITHDDDQAGRMSK